MKATETGGTTGGVSERASTSSSEFLSLEEQDRLVTWTLIRAARRVERMLVDLFAGYGLTPVQFGVLIILATGTPLTQSQLASAVLIRPQSMNTVIAEMAERGLLERVGPGGRGRPTPIQLTSDGTELLRRIMPSVHSANEPGRIGLDPGSAEKLNDILLKVLASDLPTEFEVDFRAPGKTAT